MENDNIIESRQYFGGKDLVPGFVIYFAIVGVCVLIAGCCLGAIGITCCRKAWELYHNYKNDDHVTSTSDDNNSCILLSDINSDTSNQEVHLQGTGDTQYELI